MLNALSAGTTWMYPTRPVLDVIPRPDPKAVRNQSDPDSVIFIIGLKPVNIESSRT